MVYLPVDDPQRKAGGGSHRERLLRPVLLVGRLVVVSYAGGNTRGGAIDFDSLKVSREVGGSCLAPTCPLGNRNDHRSHVSCPLVVFVQRGTHICLPPIKRRSRLAPCTAIEEGQLPVPKAPPVPWLLEVKPYLPASREMIEWRQTSVLYLQRNLL